MEYKTEAPREPARPECLRSSTFLFFIFLLTFITSTDDEHELLGWPFQGCLLGSGGGRENTGKLWECWWGGQELEARKFDTF